MRPNLVSSGALHGALAGAPKANDTVLRARLSDEWMHRLNTMQVLAVAVLILLPIAWMVLSSLKPSAEVTAYPPKFLFAPTLDNYRQLFQTTPFLEYTWNSMVVTVGSTLIGLVLGVPLAFATSWTRITWPATVTLLARMAPGTLFLLPWYVMFRELGLIGSYSALVVTHAVITMPIVVWVLLPFFDGLPRSVLESAQVDGCSVPRILWRIALPMVMPGLVVAAILAFVFSWNYFLFALVLSTGDTKTLIAASFNFIGEGATYWGALMAAATLIALPPLILAFIVQRRLVAGLAIGAVKG
jgi:multiple sugar transport system permease protein